MDIQKGYCHCGCGQKTTLAPTNSKEKGWIKGQPIRFVLGHHMKTRQKKLNSHWKGGRKICKGYVLILTPGHPRADVKGYVFEHIWVLEKALNRAVLSTEASHHINGKKDDNSPGNLMLFATKAMHISYHRRLIAYKACGYYDWRCCVRCHQYDEPKNLTISGYSAYHKKCEAEYKKNHYQPKDCPLPDHKIQE